MFSEEGPPVHAAFLILFSRDEKNYYLNSLMWIMNICSSEGFEQRWKEAEDDYGLRMAVVETIVKNEGLRTDQPSADAS